MSELDKKAIGARIKSLRGDETQKAFADRLGVGRTSVVRYEAGERTPDAEFMAKANAVLGVDLIWLLTGVRTTPAGEALKPDEAALLDNYRNSPKEARDALKATSAALAQPKADSKTG